MSKRSYLRKSAITLGATLGIGALGSVASAQIILPPDLTIGSVSATPGLLEGRVAGAFNVTDPNPGQVGTIGGVKLEPIIAQTTGGNNVEPWPDNITYIYSGEMFFPDNTGLGVSQFAMAEHVDDSTQIKIDGIVRLNNTVWNAVNSTGALSVAPGWHAIELRFGEGGGGAGPSTDTAADADPNNPWTTALGFGVDFTLPIEGDLKQPSYTRPVDPGNGTVFRIATYNTDTSKDNQSVTVNADAKLTIIQNRTVPFGNLTVANGAALTVDATVSTTTFAGTTLGAGSTLNIASGAVNSGPMTTTGGTVNKTGFSTLQVAPGTTVNPATTFNVSQGTLEITNNNAVTSLNGASITLSGGRLFTNASVERITQSHVGDAAFNGIFIEDVLEPGTTPGSNYLVFRGITAPSFGLTTTPLVGGTARAPVNAVEIRNGTIDIAMKFGQAQPDGAGGDDGNSLVNGPAGVNNEANWNNFGAGDVFSQLTPQPLNVDVNGTVSASGASVTWNSAGHWSSTGRGEENNTAPAGENRDLMAGYLDTGAVGGVGVTVNVTDLPAAITSGAGYDVYVYIQGGVNGRGGDYTLVNNAPINFASNVTVTENSAIGSNGGPPLVFGDLSVAAGKTLTVESGNYRFQDVNLNSGTQTISLNTGVIAALGHFTDGANTGVTLIKAGPGTLNLTDGTDDLDGTTINVPTGTLQVTTPASGANPLSAAAVQLSGGTLALNPSAFGLAVYNNNVAVTANSTINVIGATGEATIGNVAVNSGLTLTKTGNLLRTGNVNLAGSATFNVTGNMNVASINDGTNTGTLTKSGGGTLFVQGAGDLNGSSVVVNGGILNAAVADSLANAVTINATNGAGLRVSHADAVSAATPITVDRASFVDFDVPMTSSRKVTVPAFAALVGQLDNLSYGTGANQVSLVNNSVLAPDPGETNLPAPVPGGRLLLGITANNGTYTHGGATSTGPTDLYRAVAIGGWTDPGALAANLSGPTGGPLDIEIVAPPGLLPGNVTFKNINPLATQFNPANGTVNMTGQGRVIINAGGDIGGSWTLLNRTGDPNFFGANNVVLELGGGVPAGTNTIAGSETVILRHGGINLPGGAGANATVVAGNVVIREGGNLILDDGGTNALGGGTFTVTGTAGTLIRDIFDTIIDINGDGLRDNNDASTGPGLIYTNQGDNTNVLNGGATFNVGEGFLLVIDSENMTDESGFIAVMPKADIILDDADRDDFTAPILLGNGRRLTTTSNNSADINNNATQERLAPDPTIVGVAGARVILSAAEARTLDINDQNPNFAGVTLQLGDDEAFTTTEGNGGQNTGFGDQRLQRRTVAQGGRVRLAGVTADNIVVQSGRVDFEDNVAVTLAATGNLTIEGGMVFIDDNALHTTALTAGNWGRTGSEIRIEGGGVLRAEFQQQAGVRNVAQTIRATGPGVAELITDNGGGSGGTNVLWQNVILGSGSTLSFSVDGASMTATVNATAGNGAIENNFNNTAINVNVNAGTQAALFTGSRLTQLAGPVTASQIRVGDGANRSGRLAIANQAHVGTTPIVVSPFSHLAFNPGTGNTFTPSMATITQGSGTLRAQSGTVDFGTGVLNGGTATATPVAGLHHSYLPGAANLTEPNANVDVNLGPLAATASNLEFTPPFPISNTTHVYSGEFFDADGIVAFAEHFDDTVLLRIDGRNILNSTQWDVPTSSPDDDATMPGLQTNIGAGNGGWHSFEVRISQGGGGVGAPGNQGGADWQFGTFGFGFNPNPGTSITNPTLQSNYQPMLDNGSMNLFRTAANPGAGDLYVDGAAKMQMGSFTNQDSLTLSGNGTNVANLTLVNATATNTLLRTRVEGPGAIDSPAGSTVNTGALTMLNTATLTKLGGGTLNINGVQSIATGSTLAASAGTTNIGASFGGSNRLATLSVGAGATARITAGGTKNVVTNALSIPGGATPTGTLDVTNNAVVVDYPAAGPSPAADIRSQIISGRGAPGLLGTWDGLGITSSTSAAAADTTSVGYAVNGDMPLGALTTFRGETVDASSIIIRHTRTGDANLDGVVNDDDVTIVGAMYAPGVANAAWGNGDFDYNGFVDDDDVTLLGALYDPSATPIPAPQGGAGGVAAVPEPASWLMLTLGGLGAGLFGWRRRKSQK